MQSKNQPNKAQKDFRENLRSLYPGSEIHHLYGASARVKIDLVSTNVGHWAIIAMLPNHDEMIKALGGNRREYEKETWIIQMGVYLVEHGELPFAEEIYKAILGYHK